MAKSAEAFRTISEAANELDVPQHVLRHWEEVFGQIRPMRRAGGRRYYRPVDLDLLRGVRVLLYDERYTTKGVQKIFKEHGLKYIAEIGRLAAAGEPLELRADLTDESETIEDASEVSTAQNPSEMKDDLLPRLEKLMADIEAARSAVDEALLALDAIEAQLNIENESEPSDE
ncbi:MAG: MerR family transcriptional regulator [Pseudomonadota bacterium]